MRRTILMLGSAIAVCLLSLCACASTGLPKADADSLHDIELATARAYSYADGGPARAFDRAAYCAAAAIIRRNDAGSATYDTKGAIKCSAPERQ